MKRKTLAILGAIVAMFTLVLFVLQAQSASARNITLKEILFPQIAPAQIGQATPITTESIEPTATVFPEGMPNPSTQESMWVTISPEQMKKNEAVVEVVRSLIEKSGKIYLSAGWVHNTTKTESFSSLSSTLPDGSPIPTEWTTDTWLLLDENGYVIKGVTIQDTGSPTTSEVSKYENGVWTNITLGTSFDTRKKSYRPIDGILEKAITDKDMVELEISDGVFGNEQVKVFTLTERNNKPLEIAKSGYTVMGSMLKYYISTDTGLILGMEQYDIAPDSQYKLIQRSTIIEDMKIDRPSTEVLKYLE